MSFALRPDVKARLDRFRNGGGVINVSRLSNDAIERDLDRQQGGNRVVERLKVELTERRGPEWTAGYQVGRKWAEEQANWREITDFGTRYSPDDVQVERKREGYMGEPGMYDFEWLEFTGRFCAPAEDYGQDSPSGSGAPAYREGDDEVTWQHDEWRCQRFWRGWLVAVNDVYTLTESYLPSVKDQLPPLPPLPSQPATPHVNSNDIPF